MRTLGKTGSMSSDWVNNKVFSKIISWNKWPSIETFFSTDRVWTLLDMKRWIRSKRREHEKLMINHCFDWKALIASFQFREKGRKKKKRVDWAMWCDVIGFCAFLQQRLISELTFKRPIQKDQSFFPTILQSFRDLMFTCSSCSTTGGWYYKICKIKYGLWNIVSVNTANTSDSFLVFRILIHAGPLLLDAGEASVEIKLLNDELILALSHRKTQCIELQLYFTVWQNVSYQVKLQSSALGHSETDTSGTSNIPYSPLSWREALAVPSSCAKVALRILENFICSFK